MRRPRIGGVGRTCNAFSGGRGWGVLACTCHPMQSSAQARLARKSRRRVPYPISEAWGGGLTDAGGLWGSSVFRRPSVPHPVLSERDGAPGCRNGMGHPARVFFGILQSPTPSFGTGWGTRRLGIGGGAHPVFVCYLLCLSSRSTIRAMCGASGASRRRGFSLMGWTRRSLAAWRAWNSMSGSVSPLPARSCSDTKCPP